MPSKITWKSWLKHAFAVDTELPPPTAQEMALVELIAKEVVRRGMTTPAVTFLEVSQPLNYVGSQAMHFFKPLLSSLTDTNGYHKFAEFLARRDALEILIKEIEKCDAAASRSESSTAGNSQSAVAGQQGTGKPEEGR